MEDEYFAVGDFVVPGPLTLEFYERYWTENKVYEVQLGLTGQPIVLSDIPDKLYIGAGFLFAQKGDGWFEPVVAPVMQTPTVKRRIFG